MAKFWLLWCGLVCSADLLSSQKPAVSPLFSLSFCQLKGTKAFIFKCGHCSGFSGTFCCTASQSLFCLSWTGYMKSFHLHRKQEPARKDQIRSEQSRSDLHAILLLMNWGPGKKLEPCTPRSSLLTLVTFACSECFRKHFISFTLDFPDT